MRVLSFIPDHRIKSTNVLIELTIGEYLKIANDILSNNEYQRKKVIKGKIQELLKSDLLKGCTIPPIVLAARKSSISPEFDYEVLKDSALVEKIFNASDLLLLDGLQRTYVMLEIEKEYNAGVTSEEKKITDEEYGFFVNQLIRAELYLGLNKLGILYRMLTLNTGQTTMSSKHLMEILYLDYLDTQEEGVTLVTDKQDRALKNDTSEFYFKEVLDGYYSFLEGNEIPIERADILENIQSLRELEKTDEEKEGFRSFLKSYKATADKFIELSNEFVYEEAKLGPEYMLSGPPFGRTALDMFRKSQSFTGFGAACNFLKNRRGYSFEMLLSDIPNVGFESSDAYDTFNLVNKHFDYIRNKSKKVGNDQRYYFKVFFQSLLDNESDFYLKADLSFEHAYKRVKEKLED